jgi:hypothetical protein
MKNLLLTTALLGLIATSGANAASISPINGVEGEQLCKEHIATLVSDSRMTDSEIEFQRRSASSFRSSNFTYWINASSKLGEQKGPLRYRCEISRTGEVMEIIEESGRWNI